jgi:hypothetical protein
MAFLYLLVHLQYTIGIADGAALLGLCVSAYNLAVRSNESWGHCGDIHSLEREAGSYTGFVDVRMLEARALVAADAAVLGR